jgi:hypothetical protein
VLLDNLRLQLQQHDYAEVLFLAGRLKTAGMDKDTQAKITTIVEQVTALRTQPDAYTMRGTIDDTGRWSVQLFKRSFQVESPAGAVSILKLKCKGGYVSFPFDPQITYTAPKNLGDCRLSLEGPPGAAITLTQS